MQNPRFDFLAGHERPAKIIAHEADIAHANVPHERSAPISLNPSQCGSISGIDPLTTGAPQFTTNAPQIYFFIFLSGLSVSFCANAGMKKTATWL